MVTKNNIIRHGLWGGFFGLICGAMISGIKFVNYSSSYGRFFSKWNTEINWLPKQNPHFSHTLFWLIHFLMPGLLLGLVFGIGGKSLKKALFAIIGGLIGGIFVYWLHSFEDAAVLISAFPSISYVIFISLLVGFGDKSFREIIGGITGGAIASIPIGILTIIFMSVAAWSTWKPNLDYEYFMSIPDQICMFVLLTIGVYIGMERRNKK